MHDLLTIYVYEQYGKTFHILWCYKNRYDSSIDSPIVVKSNIAMPDIDRICRIQTEVRVKYQVSIILIIPSAAQIPSQVLLSIDHDHFQLISDHCKLIFDLVISGKSNLHQPSQEPIDLELIETQIMIPVSDRPFVVIYLKERAVAFIPTL